MKYGGSELGKGVTFGENTQIQFRAHIAFKLVWSPVDDYSSFVLVDDDGDLLANGTPTGQLPGMSQRQMNFQIVSGSKYATAAQSLSS